MLELCLSACSCRPMPLTNMLQQRGIMLTSTALDLTIPIAFLEQEQTSRTVMELQNLKIEYVNIRLTQNSI